MRLLQPLSRRHPPDARARPRRFPLLDRVAAGPARGAGTRERTRARLLRQAGRRAARSRNSSLRDALSLGPAAGARGRRGLAGARDRRRVRRVRASCGRPAGRPPDRVDHAQRTMGLGLGRLRLGPPCARAGQRGRRARRRAPSPARARTRGRGAAARGAPGRRRDHAQSRPRVPGISRRGRRRCGAPRCSSTSRRACQRSATRT